MRLKKCQRIKKQADFEQFRTNSIYCNGRGFFVKIKRNQSNRVSRFAVIVGKKVGKAHERNRVKRIFREIFREEQSHLNPKNDYLIIARKGILPNFWSLRNQFLHMCTDFSKPFLSIAIDGMAASGKSSTARALAKKHRFLNINTGDHYRSLTFYFLQKNIQTVTDPRIPEELNRLVLATQLDSTSERLSVNGKVLHHMELHSEELNQKVASFARIPELRQKLKIYQQSLIEFAKKMNFTGIVMEGRDICSVIMPTASAKFFLTADSHIRAHRRASEGEKDVVEQRDAMDRYYSDLHTIIIDTSKNTLEQVIAIIEEHIPIN
ncbi:MAG: ribonuclease P protein component [Puniceicoccales bacterium]|jgi:cytidylate kinase|nr:ribonuclease P protein component [Puniceicoccales bacterium]